MNRQRAPATTRELKVSSAVIGSFCRLSVVCRCISRSFLSLIWFVRLKEKIQPRRPVLEKQASQLAVLLAPDDDERRDVRLHDEVPAQFLRVPSLTECFDQALAAFRIGVDQRLQFAPDEFGWVIVHGSFLLLRPFDLAGRVRFQLLVFHLSAVRWIDLLGEDLLAVDCSELIRVSDPAKPYAQPAVAVSNVDLSIVICESVPLRGKGGARSLD